ncbi:hypothetical protein OIU77_010054, partial [Salix suchowensis]
MSSEDFTVKNPLFRKLKANGNTSKRTVSSFAST